MENTATATATELEAIHQKLDYLTAQFEIIAKRQQEADELKRDMLPIANQMVKLTINELEEIGTEFQVEDLLFLLKRLLRNTRSLVRLMDYLEAGIGLSDEIELLGKQVFANIVDTLDHLERKGYFSFMQEGWAIMDKIISEFTQDDVKALGDNIVTILTTVKNMTQPDILALANNAVSALQVEEEMEEVSTLQLIKELSDPRVRRGMARLLNLVKAMADEPSKTNGNSGGKA
jgi:uncharacterized protein YjgD (DUF1641 family)